MSVHPAGSSNMNSRTKYTVQRAVAELTISIANPTLLPMRETPLLKTVTIDALVQSIAKCSLEASECSPKLLASLVKTATTTLLLLKPLLPSDSGGGELPDASDEVVVLSERINHYITFLADRRVNPFKKTCFKNSPHQTAKLLQTGTTNLYALLRHNTDEIDQILENVDLMPEDVR